MPFVAKSPQGEPVADESDVMEEQDVAEAAEGEEAPVKMALNVSIDKAGPCRKHVRITVPREDIDRVWQQQVDHLMDSAEVPGFRVGHVPEPLIRKRFRTELGEQVKQKILFQSLEQISEDERLDPINEPNLDLDSIEVPEEGDFEYEFEVEVRPEFDLPRYKGLKIKRPVREITDADVEAYTQTFLGQYGQLEPIDEPASPGDFVTVKAVFTHDGKPLRTIDEISFRVRPILRFQDAELARFDKLMTGAASGDVREADLTVSLEAENVAMRGETVHAALEVLDVKRLRLPELNEEFFARINTDDAADLRRKVREMLERQVTYQQRQATRKQVMEKITESADWDLPEDLVRKQVENALRREVLEMQQAGFTTQEIRARENELRQQSITMARQNLKEHFVLDRIAKEEKIEVDASDIDREIMLMSLQAGENPRRVHARLQKTGVIENLEAQIRERKAVDVLLDHAEFKDVPMDPITRPDVEAVDRSLCSTIADTDVGPEHDHDHDGDHDHDHDD
jgi:trigger factor